MNITITTTAVTIAIRKPTLYCIEYLLSHCLENKRIARAFAISSLHVCMYPQLSSQLQESYCSVVASDSLPAIIWGRNLYSACDVFVPHQSCPLFPSALMGASHWVSQLLVSHLQIAWTSLQCRYNNKGQTSTLYRSTCEVRGGTSEVPLSHLEGRSGA